MMVPLKLLDPSTVVRVDTDAVRVLVRGPVAMKLYDLTREAVRQSQLLGRPLHLYFDGGEGLDVDELEAALLYYRLRQSRGDADPLVVHVVDGSYVQCLLSHFESPHILEIHSEPPSAMRG